MPGCRCCGPSASRRWTCRHTELRGAPSGRKGGCLPRAADCGNRANGSSAQPCGSSAPPLHLRSMRGKRTCSSWALAQRQPAPAGPSRPPTRCRASSRPARLPAPRHRPRRRPRGCPCPSRPSRGPAGGKRSSGGRTCRSGGTCRRTRRPCRRSCRRLCHRSCRRPCLASLCLCPCLCPWPGLGSHRSGGPSAPARSTSVRPPRPASRS